MLTVEHDPVLPKPSHHHQVVVKAPRTPDISSVALRLDDFRIFVSLKEEGLRPHAHPGHTHANLSRLLANLSWLKRKSAGDRTKGLRYEACIL
jgi:hypothetical protein